MNFNQAEQLSKKVNIIARIIVIVVAIIMFVIMAFGIVDIVPTKLEGKAKEYSEEFLANGDADYVEFSLAVTEFVSEVENGRKPSLQCRQEIILKAYNVAKDLKKFDEPARTEMENALNDFFKGYLGFEEMNMAFLKPEKNGKYRKSLPTSEHFDMCRILENKVEEMLR